MNKSYFLAALTAVSFSLAITGCSNDELTESPIQQQGTTSKSIAFSVETAKTTRATGDAPTLLSNRFYVLGKKELEGQLPQEVFDDVPVNYVNGKWDYVAAGQSVVAWDKSATQYMFRAYSDANTTKKVVKPASSAEDIKINSVTADELGKIYVSPLKTILPAAYGEHVHFQFSNAAAKMRIAFYNAIPEYNVIIDDFCVSSTDETGGKNAVLFGDNGFYKTAAYSVARVDAALTVQAGTPVPASSLTLGNWICTNSNTSHYLGNTISAAVFDTQNGDYHFVHPVQDAAKDIKLKVKYRIISGQDIHTKTSTVIIPAIYAQWKPNHAYTYFFKITDNDLHPISFSAEVIDFTTEETITTIDGEQDVNITTWAEGSDVQSDSDYRVGQTIYVDIANYDTTISVSYAHSTDPDMDGSAASAIPDSQFETLYPATTGRYNFTVEAAGKYVIRVIYRCTNTEHTDNHTAYKVITVKDAPVGD